MTINVNLIPQVQQVTDLNDNIITLSSDQIIKLKEVDAGTIVTYLANRGAGNIKNVTVTESQTTIITGSGGRLQRIYSNDENALIAINSNNIIFLDQKTTETIVTYYDFTNTPALLHIGDDASSINTAAGNTYSVTTTTTNNVPSQTRYINSLFVNKMANVLNANGGNLSLTSAVLVAAGTGWVANETFDFAGGTEIPVASATGIVNTIKPVSLATNAAGESYNVGDTILTAGGTASTHATLTVTNIKAVNEPITEVEGSGFMTGDTFSISSGTGTQAVYQVKAVAGQVTTISIVSGGNYTVRPTLGAILPTTVLTGGGSGLTVTVGEGDYGVLTAAITTAGSYTVGNVAFTQNISSGVGTGATFNTVVYGIDTFTITDGGSYTVAPSNPVSEDNASGTGTGATFTGTFTAEETQILYDSKKTAFEKLSVIQTIVELIATQNAL